MNERKMAKDMLNEAINGSFNEGDSPYREELKELFFGKRTKVEKDGREVVEYSGSLVGLVWSAGYKYLGYRNRKKKVIDLLLPGEVWFLAEVHRRVCSDLEKMYAENKPNDPGFRAARSDVVSLVEMDAAVLEGELKAAGRWLAAPLPAADAAPGRFVRVMGCWMPPVGTRLLVETDFLKFVEVEIVPSEGVEGAHSPRYGFMTVGGEHFIGALTDLVRHCRKKTVPAWDVCMTHAKMLGGGTCSPAVRRVLEGGRAKLLRSTRDGAIPKGVVTASQGCPFPWEKSLQRVRSVREVSEEAAGWLETGNPGVPLSEPDPGPEEARPGPAGLPGSVPFRAQGGTYWQALRDGNVVWPGHVFGSQKLASRFGGDARKVDVIVDDDGNRRIMGPVVAPVLTDKEADDLIENRLRKYLSAYKDDAKNLRATVARGASIEFDRHIVEMHSVRQAAKAVGYAPRQAANHLEKLLERQMSDRLRDVGGVKFREGSLNGGA